MITITGKSVFGGVSIGKLSFYKRNQKRIRGYLTFKLKRVY